MWQGKLMSSTHSNSTLSTYFCLSMPHLYYLIWIMVSMPGATLLKLILTILLLAKRALRMINNTDFRSHTDSLSLSDKLLKVHDLKRTFLSCPAANSHPLFHLSLKTMKHTYTQHNKHLMITIFSILKIQFFFLFKCFWKP